MAKERMKSDYSIKYFIPYIYNRIKKTYPNISKVTINKVLTMYFEMAMKDLAEGNEIVLPNKLGSLYITKRKCSVTIDPETGNIKNTFPINIAESIKLWKDKPELKGIRFVRYTNEHSNNYSFNLRFGLKKAMYRNKQIYSFQFGKAMKKELNTAIKEKRTQAFVNLRYNE